MEKQYLDIMKDIIEFGDIKNPARENMPRTRELFCTVIRHDLQKGFPLLTTRKMPIRGTFEELLWFLRGSTNVGELVRANCNFWNEDVYRYNAKFTLNMPEFNSWLTNLKAGNDYITDAGKLYGYQWRKFGGDTDQICRLINMINEMPNSRYQVVSAFDASAIANAETALPPCHMIWQTNVREGKYLDLMMLQRSCDFPIGVPVNIASYALLVHLLCTVTPYQPGNLVWVGNSTHIYENQIETCKIQLERTPKNLPTLKINVPKKTIQHWDSDSLTKYFETLKFEDIELLNYNPHQKLNYEFSSGLIKK